MQGRDVHTPKSVLFQQRLFVVFSGIRAALGRFALDFAHKKGLRRGRSPSGYAENAGSVLGSGLDRGFYNRPGAQTAGAHEKFLDLPGIQLDPDFLQIRVEPAFGFVVGMTDIVAHLGFFAANSAFSAHGISPFANFIRIYSFPGRKTSLNAPTSC